MNTSYARRRELAKLAAGLGAELRVKVYQSAKTDRFTLSYEQFCCRGGGAGRRARAGNLDAPDPYCPCTRGERMRIDWEATAARDLPMLGSACTTVGSAC